MFTKISRRKALTIGALSTGGCINRRAYSQTIRENLEPPHPPFLTPWSPLPTQKRDITAGKTPIRLASWSQDAHLNYNKNYSINDRVKTIRNMGYTSACSVWGTSGRNPWLEASESEVRELKKALAEYDVTFFDVHTYTNNIHPDAAQRKKNHRYIIEQCETAERVGAQMITTHAGTMSTLHPISPHKDNWTWETWRRVVSVMKQLLKDTSGMKVEFAIEAVNMTCMNNPRAHLRLIEDVDDPRLKVCLDPVNMMHPGVHFRTTELVHECFDLLGENIIAGHCKDTYMLPDKMSMYLTEVMPGKGTMDFESYLLRLSNLDYPRTLLIEHGHSEQFPDWENPEPKQFIENMAAQLGVTIYS
ncbi:sugar phosphate isomerase/epimerase family protein [Candidatus Latescibacterota bacterium]